MNRRVLFCLCAISLSCTTTEHRTSSGAAGSDGGAVGAAGNNGTAGANQTGQAGSSGAAGNNAGTAGVTGAAGNTGLAGTTGQAGSMGVAGSTGQGGRAGSGAAGMGAAGSGAAGMGAAGMGAAGMGAGGTFVIGTGGMPAITDSACGHLLPTQTGESVLQRGKNAQRTAHFIEPSLTTAAVMAKMGPDTTFNAAAKFTGNLEGVPLFVQGSAAGKGMYIVASHGGGNSILTAIDETSGVTLWSHVLGAAGNGVRSTPVIDANGIVYTAFDATTGGAHFEIHASSIANKGAEVGGWPVNAATIKSGNGDMLGGFDVGKEIQRGALSLVNGILYVPFGGVYGDGPPYKGFVVAVNTANPTQTGAWSASGDRSGLWTGGGLASDGTSIYATTANGGDANHMDSEEVVRITGMGASSHTAKDVFFPSSWHTWDGQDNDFGSSSPLVVQFSGACQAMVISPSKPGHLFFMDPTNLGGGNGNTPLRDYLVATNANPGGEYKVFYAAPTAYISTSGVHVAMEARVDANCGGGDQLVSVKVDMTTTPPTPSIGWCVPVQGGEDRHSPISTTTDGLNNAIVWFVFNSGLSAYDGDKGGTALFTSTPCGTVEKQTAPIAADGHVVVGADGKLCSYSVQP